MTATNQVFFLHDEWRMVFGGVIARLGWATKGAARAQLRLLESGYSTMDGDGNIRHAALRSGQTVGRVVVVAKAVGL